MTRIDKLNTMVGKFSRHMINLPQRGEESIWDERRSPNQIAVERSFREKIGGNWNSKERDHIVFPTPRFLEPIQEVQDSKYILFERKRYK